MAPQAAWSSSEFMPLGPWWNCISLLESFAGVVIGTVYFHTASGVLQNGV